MPETEERPGKQEIKQHQQVPSGTKICAALQPHKHWQAHQRKLRKLPSLADSHKITKQPRPSPLRTDRNASNHIRQPRKFFIAVAHCRKNALQATLPTISEYTQDTNDKQESSTMIDAGIFCLHALHTLYKHQQRIKHER